MKELTLLRRGGYADGDAAAGMERQRALIEVTRPLMTDGAVLSHTSAAALHDLPVQTRDLDVVTVTRPRSWGGHDRTWLHTYPCPFEADEVVMIDGLAVTSRERTCIDIARHARFADGVVVMDAALAGGASRETMTDLLARYPRRPGNDRARKVLVFADGRAESPGESYSRVALDELGVAPTHLQFVVLDRYGRFVGRSDFAWPGFRLLGEFDGKVKYADRIPPGKTVADVVMAEKEREERLKEQNWWVVRWGWADLADKAAFGRRIRTAMEMGAKLL